MDNYNDTQNQPLNNNEPVENTDNTENEKVINIETEAVKPPVPQTPQNIVTEINEPTAISESTENNCMSQYQEYIAKTQSEVPTYSVNTTTRKTQSNKMSPGLKAFLIIVLTFIGALLIAFIAYIWSSTPLNKAEGYGQYYYSTPNVTIPTEAPTENNDTGAYDPNSPVDADFKGIKLESKPKNNKDNYGASYSFKHLDNTVVGVVCYPKDSGFSGDYQTQGTGIVVSKDGYIVTNSHIINNSRNLYDIKVVTKDKKEYEAQVVGFDSRTDLAVLKIKANSLSVATFGDSDQIEITEDVIAIGNPRGLDYQNSVTKGIVSAVDRVASSNNSSKFIQIDAAINPGNSGGPLCNMYGQVIGITTSKITLDDYEGMGFAIPSKTVKKIVDDIIRYSYVQNRVKIGITGTAVISKEYDIKGIEIVSIEKDSPLTGTKAQVGDIIIGLGGTKVTTFTEVYNVLEEYRSGDEIEVKLFRHSDESEFTVKITLKADK